MAAQVWEISIKFLPANNFSELSPRLIGVDKLKVLDSMQQCFPANRDRKDRRTDKYIGIENDTTQITLRH